MKYKEPLLLFRNEGGKLRDVSKGAGPAFEQQLSRPRPGRRRHRQRRPARRAHLEQRRGAGAAANVAGAGHHWLGLTLQGTGCNRDAIGAKITWSVGGQTRTRLKNAGGSYLSSHDPREVLGIGTATKVDWIEITWPQPSGRVERLTNLPLDRYVRIVEGRGVQE